MTRLFRIGFLSAMASVIAIIAPCTASPVEVTNLAGLEDIFGRYAPGGDCKRQPQILVELSGLTFEVPGATVKVTNPSTPSVTLPTITTASASGSFHSASQTATPS